MAVASSVDTSGATLVVATLIGAASGVPAARASRAATMRATVLSTSRERPLPAAATPKTLPARVLRKVASRGFLNTPLAAFLSAAGTAD